ncbi:hypothetical protein IMG5_144080 [Ichthyophthirius multifiliis]|uniref:Uncharacterized protein n=1 Tax=Ichthyophthirius multifiliis TaxID=5932 RepID=G0QXN3_ICHMU|nr:hypothetical protein IMG5_144080 [Ichthyophthirius multifiliis]EGR30033.1 hypothetical protein IMG5_144080 [Ichthyophthirius multifiliis]|eukprot:XP_004031269.1 hypothetical protein IMG5_144080 [Ichthyophthirius multifiliis]
MKIIIQFFFPFFYLLLLLDLDLDFFFGDLFLELLEETDASSSEFSEDDELSEEDELPEEEELASSSSEEDGVTIIIY